MDAALALGRGYPLHAVDARLSAEVPERAFPAHLDERLLVRARGPARRAPRADALDRNGLDDLGLPPLALRDALVHADELGRKEARFVPADAGFQLDEGREGREGRGGREAVEEVSAGVPEGEFGGGEVRLGEFAEVFVRFGAGQVPERVDELSEGYGLIGLSFGGAIQGPSCRSAYLLCLFEVVQGSPDAFDLVVAFRGLDRIAFARMMFSPLDGVCLFPLHAVVGEDDVGGRDEVFVKRSGFV